MALLDTAAVTFQVVLTKVDKPKGNDIDQAVERLKLVLAKHPAAYPEIILTSSAKSFGLDTLRTTIASIGQN